MATDHLQITLTVEHFAFERVPSQIEAMLRRIYADILNDIVKQGVVLSGPTKHQPTILKLEFDEEKVEASLRAALASGGFGSDRRHQLPQDVYSQAFGRGTR